MEILDRMKTGRFKVARHLNEWFEEFRHYHRKEGKIVKKNDDLLSATRIGVMMLRFARDSGGSQAIPIMAGHDYDPLSPAPSRAIFADFDPKSYADSYDPLGG